MVARTFVLFQQLCYNNFEHQFAMGLPETGSINSNPVA